MEKFLNLVLGTNDVPTYFAALFFAMIGVVIILLVKSKKRDKTSQNTPYHFSFKFLILDNLKEIILGFLLIMIALRFSIEYAGVGLTMWYALGVGLSIQKLSGYISKLESGARK
ncbi:hypothetical protein [Flavobacterium sp. 5]|uniref:hypothetical protein n=1 Tax=Flavobacterium sp. 5 TaxID=2035199 RepID=UPI000C2BE45C|nr:hypothetical protein [Flavobacterium sp. 5]PKB18395.1 hypothetical protein CLU82_3670 [Flavobacterium sp. 5]